MSIRRSIDVETTSAAYGHRTSSLCCLSIFSSLELSHASTKDKLDFNRFWKASSHVIFLLQKPLSSPSPKGTCSFNRPWCSFLNWTRASTRFIYKNFFFSWSHDFSAFEPPKIVPPKVCAISMASSVPWNKSSRHMNPVFNN